MSVANIGSSRHEEEKRGELAHVRVLRERQRERHEMLWRVDAASYLLYVEHNVQLAHVAKISVHGFYYTVNKLHNSELILGNESKAKVGQHWCCSFSCNVSTVWHK